MVAEAIDRVTPTLQDTFCPLELSWKLRVKLAILGEIPALPPDRRDRSKMRQIIRGPNFAQILNTGEVFQQPLDGMGTRRLVYTNEYRFIRAGVRTFMSAPNYRYLQPW